MEGWWFASAIFMGGFDVIMGREEGVKGRGKEMGRGGLRPGPVVAKEAIYGGGVAGGAKVVKGGVCGMMCEV